MTSKKEPVELRHAFEWTCPDCGTDQFERAIACEITDEDREAQEELADSVTGDWMLAPERVTCKRCGKQFPTIDPGEG